MITRDLPIIRNIEVTNSCNLNCPVCVEKNNSRGFLDMGLVDKILENNEGIFSADTVTWLHFRGEPYLHPLLFDIVNKLEQAGATTGLSTNGLLLDERKVKETVSSTLNSMVVSVMSIKEDEYKKFRGANTLSRVLKNISILSSCLLKSGSKLKVSIMGLDFGQKRSEINNFVTYFHDQGFDVAIHQYSNRSGNSRLNPTSGDIIQSKERFPCHWIFNDLIILYNGYVTTCYSDLKAENTIDSLANYHYSIRELWHGEKFHNLRNIQHNLVFEKACRECKDWIYKHPSVESKNPYVKIYPVKGKPYDL